MLIKGIGRIKFEPEDKTKKHVLQSSWKKTAMILCEDNLAEYYSWFVEKRFGLKLNKPLRGSHITFINDRGIEVPKFAEISNLYDDKTINFYYEPIPITNGEHWWLRAYCPDAEKIRVLCGGKATPYFNMHLTLGYANDRNIDHSEYILRISKMFNIISYEPRKEFEKHEIIDFGKDC